MRSLVLAVLGVAACSSWTSWLHDPYAAHSTPEPAPALTVWSNPSPSLYYDPPRRTAPAPSTNAPPQSGEVGSPNSPGPAVPDPGAGSGSDHRQRPELSPEQ